MASEDKTIELLVKLSWEVSRGIALTERVMKCREDIKNLTISND